MMMTIAPEVHAAKTPGAQTVLGFDFGPARLADPILCDIGPDGRVMPHAEVHITPETPSPLWRGRPGGDAAGRIVGVALAAGDDNTLYWISVSVVTRSGARITRSAVLPVMRD